MSIKNNKYLLFIILSITLSACATKNITVADLPLMKVAPAAEVQSVSPFDFETTIPKSKILLQSLITYENTYGRMYSDNNVINVAANDKYAAVLKADEVGMTLTYCPNLAFDKRFESVKVYGDYFIVYNGSLLKVISTAECAIIATVNKALRGDVIYHDNKIIEWQGSRVIISDIFSNKVLLDSDIGINISTAAIFNNSIILIHDNGYVMTYNPPLKAFSLSGKLEFEFIQIYYNNDIVYGITKNGEYFTTDIQTNIKNFTDCKLSKTSPIAICGDTLVTKNENYKGFKQADKFALNNELFLSVIGSNLNIYSLTKSWQRFVSFNYALAEPCMDNSSNIYFVNFSDEYVSLVNNVENIVKNIPSNCSSDKVKLVGGDFICGEKFCGNFAEKILESDNTTMYRRIENGKRYYFFTSLLDN